MKTVKTVAKLVLAFIAFSGVLSISEKTDPPTGSREALACSDPFGSC